MYSTQCTYRVTQMQQLLWSTDPCEAASQTLLLSSSCKLDACEVQAAGMPPQHLYSGSLLPETWCSRQATRNTAGYCMQLPAEMGSDSVQSMTDAIVAQLILCVPCSGTTKP